MKIKPIISQHKNKLLELQILKSKIYKNISKKKIENEKIKLHFKKVAHIIYEYHIHNKIILFANFPTRIEKNIIKLNTNIKHIFISEKNWTNGFLSNKSVNTCNQLIKNSTTKFNNKKSFFDLLVIFNPTNNNIINESYNLYIPTILITDSIFDQNISLFKQSYKILGHFKFIEEQINNNFFLSIIQAIFKNGIIKKTQQYKNINKKLLKKKLDKKKWSFYKTNHIYKKFKNK